MILGIAAAFSGIEASMTGLVDASAIVFAGGALFGKGYGVWEVRSSQRGKHGMERP